MRKFIQFVSCFHRLKRRKTIPFNNPQPFNLHKILMLRKVIKKSPELSYEKNQLLAIHELLVFIYTWFYARWNLNNKTSGLTLLYTFFKIATAAATSYCFNRLSAVSSVFLCFVRLLFLCQPLSQWKNEREIPSTLSFIIILCWHCYRK